MTAKCERNVNKEGENGFLETVCDPMSSPPPVARRRPESWIPALWITKWLRGAAMHRTR